MPTISAKPGFFDQFVDGEKAKKDMAKYGINPSGEGLYSDKAEQTRASGYGAQLEALGMYRNGALGNGESVAQRMLNQQTSANARGGLQMAAQGRGGNLAGMQQQAMAQTAGAQAQAAGQAATLRAQEMQANQAAYAGLASQMYGQGFAYDQLGAQTGLAANQQTIDWQMGKRQLDMQADQNKFARNMGIVNGVIGGVSAIGDVVGGIGGASDERLKVGVKTIDPFVDGNPYAPDADIPFVDRMNEQRRNRSSNPGGWNVPAPRQGGSFVQPATNFRYAEADDSAQDEVLAQTAAQTKSGEIAAKMGMQSDGMVASPGAAGQGEEKSGFTKIGEMIGQTKWGGGEGFGGFSDERMKQGAAPAGGQVSATQAIDNTPSASFEYAPGAGPPGRRVGVMAQDLEKTPAGAAIVHNTPQGKMVDAFGASTLALAAQSEARQREKALEARLAKLEGGVQAGQPVNAGQTLAVSQQARTRPTGEVSPTSQQVRAHKNAINRSVNPEHVSPKDALGRRNKTRFEEDTRMGEMTPEQRKMADDFMDELDRWTYVDERGQRRIGAKRMGDNTAAGAVVPRHLMRAMDADTNADRAQQSAAEDRKDRAAHAKGKRERMI